MFLILKEYSFIYIITIMNRTKYSSHSLPTRFNKQEKLINLQYGNDGEIAFLNVLRNKYGDKYFWYPFPNNYESVDFYGILQEEDGTHGVNAEIVIELKSKRLLCDKTIMRVENAVVGKNSKSNFHFCNWSKYEDIKQRLKENRCKKAFIVWDYMTKSCEEYSKYDKENSGDYYFHEITQDKIDFDDNLEEGYDHEEGKHYLQGEYQNPDRDVIDLVVNIYNTHVLPFSKFKYFLDNDETKMKSIIKKYTTKINKYHYDKKVINIMENRPFDNYRMKQITKGMNDDEYLKWRLAW